MIREIPAELQTDEYINSSNTPRIFKYHGEEVLRSRPYYLEVATASKECCQASSVRRKLE
jgi:hypothetical protein